MRFLVFFPREMGEVGHAKGMGRRGQIGATKGALFSFKEI